MSRKKSERMRQVEGGVLGTSGRDMVKVGDYLAG